MTENQNIHPKRKLSTILLVSTLIIALSIGLAFAALSAIESSRVNFGSTIVTNPTQTPPVPFNPVLSTNYVLPSTVTGTPAQFTVTLTNTGGASPSNCLVAFTITEISASAISPNIAVSTDVTLQYSDGTTYQTIPLTASGNTLSGTFGPSTGFPIGAGYDATTQMQITYNVAGTFSASAVVETVGP